MTAELSLDDGSDHALARAIAEEAGRLLVGLRTDEAFDDASGLRDAGDRLSHQLIMDRLRQHRPQDAILSEEGADDRTRLNSARVWIVEPLDGTREFGEAGRT